MGGIDAEVMTDDTFGWDWVASKAAARFAARASNSGSSPIWCPALIAVAWSGVWDDWVPGTLVATGLGISAGCGASVCFLLGFLCDKKIVKINK